MQATAVYGVQRDMMSRAEHDEAGEPRKHRYLNIFEVLRLSGPLSVGSLERALALAAADVDLFRSRFRRTDSGYEVFHAPELMWLSFAELRFNGPIDEFADSDACDAVRRVAYTSRDLKCEPLIVARLVRFSAADHLLVIVMDHAIADGRTLMVYIRAVAQRYASIVGGTSARKSPFSSFLEFAASFGHRTAERELSRRYWSAALAEAADPGSRPFFPDGRWKTPEHRELSNRVEAPLPPEALPSGGGRLAVTDPQLVFAAAQLAVCTWSETFAPINYMRHGRSQREWLNVPGPLTDHSVTVAPQAAPTGLADWIEGFTAANTSGPPCFGLSFRELETPASDENRAVLFNYLPSASPTRFGPARGQAADPPLTAAVREYDHSSRFALRFHLWQYPGRPLTLAVDFDPEFVPNGGALLDSALTIVEAAATAPEMPLRTLHQSIRERWGRLGVGTSAT